MGLEREQRVAENRQRRLQEIKMKAQRAAVRAEEARIRRAQQTNVPVEVVEEAKKSICNRTRDECTIC